MYINFKHFLTYLRLINFLISVVIKNLQMDTDYTIELESNIGSGFSEASPEFKFKTANVTTAAEYAQYGVNEILKKTTYFLFNIYVKQTIEIVSINLIKFANSFSSNKSNICLTGFDQWMATFGTTFCFTIGLWSIFDYSMYYINVIVFGQWVS